MTKQTIFLSALGLLLVSGVTAASPGEYENYYYQRGPVPFDVLDANNDGVVTAQEHATFRANRHQARSKAGYRLRNADKAPSFDQIDTDASGSISRGELEQWRNQRRQQMMGRRNW